MRLWATAILLFIGGACAKPAIPSDALTEVKAVWNTQVAAWNKADLGYMSAYWRSPDLVFFSNGDETRGWEATLERYRAKYQGEGKQMGTLDFPQLEFTMLGTDAALVRGRWHLRMLDGKEFSGMTSVVFRKLPEGWRIVHCGSSGTPVAAFASDASASGVPPIRLALNEALQRRARQTARCQLLAVVRRRRPATRTTGGRGTWRR